MKAQILKIAGVKSEKEFYKKYPSEEAFMKVHGKAFKKAQVGTYIGGEKAAPLKPINFNEAYDNVDYSITGATNKMRQDEAYKQADLQAKQKKSGGFDIAGLMSLAGSAMGGGQAEYGADIPKAQFGDTYSLGQAPNFQVGNLSAGFNPQQNNFSMQTPKFNAYNPQGNQSGTAMAQGIFQGAHSVGAAQPSTLDKIGGAIGKYAGPAGELIQEFSALKAAQQTQQLSDLSLKASQTKPEQTQRKYVRPEDMITSGNQISNSYGTGTNVLSRNGKQIRKAKGGAEIQNTYAPNDIYDDLGYEPLDDSNVKQYQNGGTPWGMIGDIGSDIGGSIVGKDAGSQIGGTLGKNIGNAIMPGIGGAVLGTVGTVVGGLLDTNDKKMKKAQDATNRNMQAMAFSQSAQALQSQNSAVMEDGGYVSHNWTPQVIAKFGDHSAEDVYDFAHEGMDSLRAGGHLRSYKNPSERAMETYAMGGELKTHWGGHMEEMSQNPYLPGDGITYMPHGQSHDETNNKGQSGIGITYGGNSKGEYGLSMAENGFIPEEAKNGGTLVEVERREPIMKLKDGSTGEDNLVVFGNLVIPFGDGKGQKFKNYVSNLSKNETKQNKTIQKSTEEIGELNPLTSFDKLKLAGLKANILGGNMKLKQIADTKTKAAALQNAINDTAEEYGFDADSLAKGKIKTAKMGGKFTKAQPGISQALNDDQPSDAEDMRVDLNDVVIPARPRKFPKPEIYTDVEMPDHIDNPYYKDPEFRPLSQLALSYDPRVSTEPSERTSFDSDPYMQLANSVLPYFRPSDSEELSGNQLLGEMYALSNNQEEPVQAQQYSPQLASRSRISLQDSMNEITAQTRAAQRMAQGNPAAQAAIAAQAYEAINKVKGEEFRMNQAGDDQLFAANIATMNDAKVKNLGILDNQYTRQAQAKSNSKAVTQAALNSISDKYAKNSLENRTLQTYENMYNYRFDANGRAINMNGVAQFNNPMVGSTSTTKDASGDDLLPIYSNKGDITGYKVKQDTKSKTKDKSRNGSIVKAMRNL